MLRRKFLIRVGLLICAFVLGAALAVWKLQDVQAELDQANADAGFLIDGIQSIGAAVNEIAANRLSASRVPGIPPESAVSTAKSEVELPAMISTLGTHPLLLVPGESADRYIALKNYLPAFLPALRQSDTSAPETTPELFAETSLRMHHLVQDLGKSLRAYVAEEQVRVGTAFRTTVIALTLAAFVMVNVSIYVLVRTTQLVLKPVAALVNGSRELAAEHFGHRVEVDRGDEFAELAHAYNSLGEQLQSNELRKTETLRQLAVTLNHDLNNTMAIIEMQLMLLDRRSGQDPSSAKPLREIRAGLLRMNRTVASLKDIRRVVLVDYGRGQKMIDLERSVAVDPTDPPVPAMSASDPSGGSSR